MEIIHQRNGKVMFSSFIYVDMKGNLTNPSSCLTSRFHSWSGTLHAEWVLSYLKGACNGFLFLRHFRKDDGCVSPLFGGLHEFFLTTDPSSASETVDQVLKT